MSEGQHAITVQDNMNEELLFVTSAETPPYNKWYERAKNIPPSKVQILRNTDKGALVKAQ